MYPKKMVSLLLALLLLLSLSSCSSKSDEGEAMLSANEVDPLRLCSRENDAGFYTIEFFFGNHGTLCYTDYAARKQIVLCDSPNCTHDSESCKSYIKIEAGDYPPMVLTAQNKILLVYSSSTAHDMAKIVEMDTNGENKETLVRLANGESIYGGIYTDDQYLYYENWRVEETSDGPINRSSICRVDLITKENKVVCNLPANLVTYSTAGTSYILYTRSPDGNILSYYELSAAKKGDDWAISSEPIYTSDSSVGGTMIWNGTIIQHDPSNHLITIGEVGTDATKRIDYTGAVPEYDPEWVPDVSYLYGGCANTKFLKLTTNYEDADGNHPPKYYVIDTEKEVISKEITLKDDFGTEMLPVGEFGDYFCVISGYDEKYTPLFTDGGDMELASFTTRKYAFILKSDYFEQIGNLIPFENCF